MQKAIQIKHDSPEELYSCAAKAGYRYMGISFGEEPVFLEEDWQQSVLRIRKRLEKYSLQCVQTYLPYYYLKLSSDILTSQHSERGALYSSLEPADKPGRCLSSQCLFRLGNAGFPGLFRRRGSIY